MISNSYTTTELESFYQKKGLPYDVEENISTISSELSIASQDLNDIPADACPEHFAVISMIMHPDFSSSRYYPEQLISFMNLDCIGIYPTDIYPRLSFGTSILQERATAFRLAGKIENINGAVQKIKNVPTDSFIAKQIATVESIESVSSYDRLDIPNNYKEELFLVSLYVFPGKTVQESRRYFIAYAKAHQYLVNEDFNFENDGLYYVLLKGRRADLDSIAEYVFVNKIQVPSFKEDFDEID